MGTSSQKSESDTKTFRESQTSNTPVQCLYDSQRTQPQIPEINTDSTDDHSGDDKFLFPKFTSSNTEETLVKDETTNELYISLSSTIVPK